MAEPKEPLTERELEIVRLVGTGAGNKEIASHLALSPNTVKVHLRNIFTKMEARSRTEVTMIAVRNGWIALSDAIKADDSITNVISQNTSIDAHGADGLTNSGQAVAIGTDVSPKTAPRAKLTQPRSEFPTSQPMPSVHVAPNPQPLPRLSPWKRYALLASLALGLVLIFVSVPVSQGNASGAVDPLRIGSPQPRNGLLLRGELSRWSLRAPLPAPRARSAAATVGDAIYVIGGEVNQIVSADVMVFEPISNTWTMLNSPKPTPVANTQAAVVNDRIYIAGGTGRDGNPTSNLEVFDTLTRSWRSLAPLDVPVAGNALAAMGRQLYMFGGATNQAVTGASRRYDVASNTWQPIAPMPTPRTLSAATTFNDRIYVVGGYSEGHELNTCEYYTPTTNQWATCDSMTVPRSGLGLVRVGYNLFAIGGGISGFLGFNERYDPATNRWTALDTPLTTDWQSVAVAARGTEFYVFGGYSGGERLALSYVYEVFTNRVYVPAFQASPDNTSKP